MEYREIRARTPEDTGTRWLAVLVRVGKFVLVLMIVPSVLIYYWPKKEHQEAMKEKVASLKRERDLLREERDKRLRKVEWIKSDVGYLEIAARDRLNLQKDGEYVIRFEEGAGAGEGPR